MYKKRITPTPFQPLAIVLETQVEWDMFVELIRRGRHASPPVPEIHALADGILSGKVSPS